jgi:CRP/FNR family transcriptional regulator, nitrogen oxide reductase regulator
MCPDLPDLRGISLFRGLPPEAIEDLSALAQQRHLCAGTLVFSEGAPARAVHVLTSGFVKMAQTTPEGARVVVRYVGPGEPFGTPALLGDQPYPADAVAVTDAIELQWPARTLQELLANHPDIALNAIRIMEERLRDLEGRLRELSNDPVERRVAQTIVRLVRKTGRNLAGKLEVPFPLTRQDIADMTGTTLHTVSRMLGAWEQQGLIERGRQRVVVTKVEALAGLAGLGDRGRGPRRTHRRSAARR